MPRKWTAVTPCRCLPFVILVLVIPRCVLSASADKSLVKQDDYYSATVNVTVMDSKGNPKQILTKDDGRYGQSSLKADAKGIVIAPAPNFGGRFPQQVAPIQC